MQRYYPQDNYAYKRSNAILNTQFCASRFARRVTSTLLNEEDAKIRQKLGQLLLDELSTYFSITPPKLIVLDKHQSHSKRNGRLSRKTFGCYNSGNIKITNKTAIRGKIVASKTFLDTLIHEFMHHYDFKVIRLTKSLHTSGFFLRMGDIIKKLTYI